MCTQGCLLTSLFGDNKETKNKHVGVQALLRAPFAFNPKGRPRQNLFTSSRHAHSKLGGPARCRWRRCLGRLAALPAWQATGDRKALSLLWSQNGETPRNGWRPFDENPQGEFMELSQTDPTPKSQVWLRNRHFFGGNPF